MNENKEEKIKREVRQVGLGIFIGGIIISLIAGACIGVFFAP